MKKKICPARSVLIKPGQINSDTQQLPECLQPGEEISYEYGRQQGTSSGVPSHPTATCELFRRHNWMPCLSKIKHASRNRRAPLKLRFSHQSTFGWGCWYSELQFYPIKYLFSVLQHPWGKRTEGRFGHPKFHPIKSQPKTCYQLDSFSLRGRARSNFRKQRMKQAATKDFSDGLW